MRFAFVSPLSLEINADYKSDEQVGAVEQQFLGLSKSLVKLGHDTSIIRLWDSDEGIESIAGVTLLNISPDRLLHRSQLEKSNSISRSIKTSFLDLVYSEKLREQVQFEDYDVVVFPNLTLSTLLSGVDSQCLFVGHTTIHEIHRERSLIKKQILRFYSRRGGAVVPLNQAVKAELEQSNVRCSNAIPNGVNISNYANLGDEQTILYSGRLVERKGVIDLVRAFRKIDSDWDLKIVGEGPVKPQLQHFVEQHSMTNVSFKDFLPREKFIEEVGKCSALVLPSYFEGMPVILLEAMASNKIVIATDIPGSRDVIDHNHNGLLYEKGDVKQLVECLEMVIENDKKRNQMAKNAKNTVVKNYTFDRVAEQYVEYVSNL